MVKQSIMTRLGALERRMGISKEPLPTVFVRVEDASIPDPDAPWPAGDYSDAAVIALRASATGLHIARLPGERVEAMKKRASKAQPECRVWWMVYRYEAGAARG